MGLNISWDITYKCNLFCAHCINGNLLNNKEEIELKEIKTIINEFRKNDVDYVHLLGGEPTFRKDFYEIAEYFNHNKIKFGFNTNGLKLNDKNMIDLILHNNSLKNIVVSIEAPIAEVNDSIRGKKVFDRSVNNLITLIKIKKDNNIEDFTFTINTVVSKANKDYILSMIDFCIELGVDELVLLQLIPEGNADKNLSLSVDEEIELVKALAGKYNDIKDKIKLVTRFTRPMASIYAKEVLGLNFPIANLGCGAGYEFAYMSNKGDIYPCERYKDNILSSYPKEKLALHKEKFNTVWEYEKFSDIFRYINTEEFNTRCTPCNECVFFGNVCIPCPVEIMNEKKEKVNIKICFRYFELIKENKNNSQDKIIYLANTSTREARFNDSFYIIQDRRYSNKLSLNKEAYKIWTELKEETPVEIGKAVNSICEKFDFCKDDIFDIINILEQEKFVEIR